MECLIQQEKISDYLDNLLPAAERQQMTEHLSVCLNCRLLYDDLTMITQASRNLPEHEPRGVVWERIWTEITTQPATAAVPALGLQESWLSRLQTLWLTPGAWRPAFSAVVLLLVGAVVVTYFRPWSPPETIGPIANIPSEPTSAPPLEIQRKFYIVHKPLNKIEKVQEHIDKLQKEIAKKESRWSPEIRDLFQQQLAYVDECITHCQKEVANGQGHVVRDLYHASLQAKLDLLSQFAGF
jgi:hypothetical protein